ncbi:uncharacterized protein [Argopecten irradians]|uniref:uncharacterized protein isoform X1 n=2 Tax=Argopecten irradians TaxID=31199 RepID=UPI0037115D09
MEGTSSTSYSVLTFFIKGLVLVTIMSSIGSINATSDEKWRRPCGISNGPSPGQPGGPPTASPETLVAAMLPALASSIADADSLKNKYISERMLERRVPHLNSFHYDGMPDVSMTPTEIEESLSDINLSHLTNYQKLSKALVFLEQVRFDETFMDNSIATYREEVQKIETSIMNVMCTKQKLIHNSGSQIDYVSHTVMPQDIRVTINDHERHERDYVIVKDTVQLLQTMQMHVTAINRQMGRNQ